MRRFGDYASFFDFNLGYAGKSDPWSLAPVLKIVRTCDYVRRKEDARRLIFRLRYCGLRSTPPHGYIKASNNLSESCPKNGDVPKSPFPTVAAVVPSAGTITL